ncbi:MAG: hypothetical protein K0S42_3600 [Microvirga sp.]|nr:hypothetical protein [Microvirga sp.]
MTIRPNRRLMEVAARRPAVVVDQNIDGWNRGQKRLLPLGRCDIGRDRDDHAAGLLADFRGGTFQRFRMAAVDHDRASGARELQGAGPAEALARGADDGVPSVQPKVHGTFPPVDMIEPAGGPVLMIQLRVPECWLE